MIKPTSRYERPYPEYELEGLISAVGYVFHKCPLGHYPLEMFGLGWACHDCHKVWAMRQDIWEEWQKPQACNQFHGGWYCARPVEHAGNCTAFEQIADRLTVLTPQEAEAVYDYIQGNGVDVDAIGRVLEKIEPVVHGLAVEELD